MQRKAGNRPLHLRHTAPHLQQPNNPTLSDTLDPPPPYSPPRSPGQHSHLIHQPTHRTKHEVTTRPIVSCNASKQQAPTLHQPRPNLRKRKRSLFAQSNGWTPESIIWMQYEHFTTLHGHINMRAHHHPWNVASSPAQRDLQGRGRPHPLEEQPLQLLRVWDRRTCTRHGDTPSHHLRRPVGPKERPFVQPVGGGGAVQKWCVLKWVVPQLNLHLPVLGSAGSSPATPPAVFPTAGPLWVAGRCKNGSVQNGWYLIICHGAPGLAHPHWQGHPGTVVRDCVGREVQMQHTHIAAQHTNHITTNARLYPFP